MRGRAGESLETDYLVLRTTVYGESGLIVSGVSPEQGKLSFMVHGARRGGRRGGSVFGLFRKLRLSYRPQERELQSCDDAELVSDHGSVSSDFGRYTGACWLSQFALQNILPGMSSSYFFDSLDLGFSRLASGVGSVASIETGVMLVYMQENGVMPLFGEGEERQAAQCQLLLEMALGGQIPALREDNWVALRDWAAGVLRGSECVVPSF